MGAALGGLVLCLLTAAILWQLLGDEIPKNIPHDEASHSTKSPQERGQESAPSPLREAEIGEVRDEFEVVPPAKVVFRVRRADGSPAPRASVFLTRKRLRKAPVTQDQAWREDYGVVHSGRTGETGELSVPCRKDGGTCYAWVEGENGVVALGGPATIDLGIEPDHPLAYTLGNVRAAAFEMSDGATIEHARWEFDSAYALGRQPPRVRKMRSVLSRKLKLGEGHVFVGVGSIDSKTLYRSRVSIFHPKLGWFRHELLLEDYDRVSTTTITPPPTGTGSPIRITIDCVSPDGKVCEGQKVRLHGMDQVRGFPRIVAIATSGQEVVVPAGQYMIQFNDSVLTKAFKGPPVMELKKDQHIKIKLRWTARKIQVAVVRGKKPMRGAATIAVNVEKRTLYQMRWGFRNSCG